MKLKWYLQTWFICLLAVFWPLYSIPLIIAIILIVLQHKEIKKFNQKCDDIEAIKVETQAVLNNANQEAIDIVGKAKQEAINMVSKADIKAASIIEQSEKESAHLRINTQAKIDELNNSIKSLKNEEKELKAQIESLGKDLVIETINLSAYDGLTSEECKDRLTVLKMKQTELVKEKKALVITSGDPKKILENNRKQLLRCFNSECNFIIGNVSVKNIDTSRGKIKKSFEVLNNIFATDGVALSYDFLEMKLEELNLLYTYELKREEEREIQKAIREQMIEEEKVRKEIEREKAKIEKEEAQFKNEVGKLMKYMQASTTDAEKELYIQKIKELEQKLSLLEKDKENVFQREQNTRAGFVYVISNIGAFGEDVYKIGMTRRLEPMDRIKELSDASVPFPFDVHAMIFSEDAPALENILHQTFRAQEVNKVNSRKEFFKTSFDEIKKVVYENYNATVQFIDVAEALQYRETLRINEQMAM